MILKKFIIFLFFLCVLSYVISQNFLPQNYFINPLSIRPVISGTFGDLRNNHFHTGLDFSTQNKQNIETFCIADGYVSRIKVSSQGYGKVIYITHYNGYVSVYGHLNDFNIAISDYVKTKQYEQEKYEIELFPPAELFRLKKGDIVGYTGNTGISSGPHLHFEIRNKKTERPINPFLFGYHFPDNKNPVIHNIYIYPANEKTLINNKNHIFSPELIKKEKKLFVKDTINISGKIFFGISANDLSDSDILCGIYSIEIFIDNNLFFHVAFDSLSFDEARYINSLIDYPSFYTEKKKIVKTYIAPGNRLKIYKTVENNGIAYFTDTIVRKVLIIVKDFNNNSTTVEFFIRARNTISPITTTQSRSEPLYRFGLKNNFESENIRIEIPPHALFDSIYFTYKTLPKTKYTYSKIHRIHNPLTPLFAPVNVSILLDTNVDSRIQSKLTLARIVNNAFEYIKTNTEGLRFIANINQFGDYCIVADTIPPEIKAIGIVNSNKIKNETPLVFKISDNFSGISSYKITINGKWVLAEYDMKNSELIYKPDPKHFKEGINILKVEVTDNMLNTKTFETTITF